MKVNARMFVEVTRAGEKGPIVGMREVAAQSPDAVACRRVRDFTQLPIDAIVGACRDCGCAVAWSPRTQAEQPDKPRVCLQCLGVTPDPL